MSVTATAPAKVNLHLSVGPARDDGFHELATIFHAVSLLDTVTVAEAAVPSVSLEGEGSAELPRGGDNLVVRAARVLAEYLGRPDCEAPQVAVRVCKQIPVAAGLAGGSADAAATLVACNELWQGGLDRNELLALAAQLGSDVPFSLVGGTCLGSGRGEVLAPVLVRGRYHWVLAFSRSSLSTAEVYGQLDRRRRARSAPEPVGAPDAVLAALANGDVHALAEALANDLDPIAQGLAPGLERTLRAGTDLGALGALVSGSGPTAAFLASSADEANRLAADLAGADVCRTVRTVTSPVPGARVTASSDDGRRP
jgi:4-diphosphocytidyl-2-C-methyl-D-erythritol kinase